MSHLNEDIKTLSEHGYVKSSKTQWKKVSVLVLEVCNLVGKRKNLGL